MTKQFRNAQAGVGIGGARKAWVGFHNDPLVSGWRLWWRNSFWSPEARRVTLLVLSNGHWIELQWLDGQGPMPPKVWGDSGMRVQNAMEKAGYRCFSWTIGPEGLRQAQAFGWSNNLSWALQSAGIKNPVRGWTRFVAVVLATCSSFSLAALLIQATTHYAGLADWIEVTILLATSWGSRPRRRFRRPEHLAKWLENAGKFEVLSGQEGAGEGADPTLAIGAKAPLMG